MGGDFIHGFTLCDVLLFRNAVTTGLPVKNPGERARVTSISSSQPAIGTTGQKVSAT